MISAFFFFLAWGSYLNSLGYRLLHLESFNTYRSFCPTCNTIIAWYDNIPVLSWLILQAQCRQCKKPISWLYPAIEIFTPCALLALWTNVSAIYFPAYFIFFSALIVSIRTDLDAMLISRFVTLYLIPFGLLAAYFQKLPISLHLAVIGMISGYLLLWIPKKISLILAKKEGIGQGDIELLAFIGAFCGPYGCWIALTLGSIIGTLTTIICMALQRKKINVIPFGPYLSIGAILFVVHQKFFINYIFGM